MTVRLAFPVLDVVAVRADRIVCVIKAGDNRYKAFQIAWGADGSLYVTFPYFPHREGILAPFTFEGNGTTQETLDFEKGGKIASHLAKYAHHLDGEAHFSQTGKILTQIRRQSVPLDQHNGHVFTLHLQGLSCLQPAIDARDQHSTSERAIIEFPIAPAPGVKFVGRWLDISKMLLFDKPSPVVGPWTETADSDGNPGRACIIGRNVANTKQFLALSVEPQLSLGPEKEMLLFYGGFDPREKMEDLTYKAGGIAFKYPVANAKLLAHRLGSIDYKPTR